MRTFLSRLLTGVLLTAFLLGGFEGGANAATVTKTLDEDTQITPPGMVAVLGAPMFKKGTVVTLNEHGEVLEGTLAEKAYLACVAGASQFYFQGIYSSQFKPQVIRWPRALVFSEGTKVTFNSKGEIVRGTIWTEDDYVSIPLSQNSLIALKPLTEVSFHENGMIATCTPYASTSTAYVYLRPVGWQQNLTAGYTSKIAFLDLSSLSKVCHLS